MLFNAWKGLVRRGDVMAIKMRRRRAAVWFSVWKLRASESARRRAALITSGLQTQVAHSEQLIKALKARVEALETANHELGMRALEASRAARHEPLTAAELVGGHAGGGGGGGGSNGGDDSDLAAAPRRMARPRSPQRLYA